MIHPYNITSLSQTSSKNYHDCSKTHVSISWIEIFSNMLTRLLAIWTINVKESLYSPPVKAYFGQPTNLMLAS
jgi:hypothetical protein